MKKLFFICILAMALIFLQTSALAVNEFMAPRIKDGKVPSLDGVISEGEWPVKPFTLDKTNSHNWTNTDTGNFSVDFYYMWNEEGFYVAAVVKNDTTPMYGPDNSHWVGKDCVELAFDPTNAMDKKANPIFFSIGAKENGDIVVYKHNYEETLLRNIKGKASGHIKGSSEYTVEFMIPWSTMKLEGIKDFDVAEGTVMGLMLCALDLEADGTSIKSMKSDGKTNFTVASLGKLTLGPSISEAGDNSISLIWIVGLVVAAVVAAIVMKQIAITKFSKNK